MCLALPAQIVALGTDDMATVDLGGIRKVICIALIERPSIGDYVIVHVGHAIGVVDQEEALRTLAIFAEISKLEAGSESL